MRTADEFRGDVGPVLRNDHGSPIEHIAPVSTFDGSRGPGGGQPAELLGADGYEAAGLDQTLQDGGVRGVRLALAVIPAPDPEEAGAA